MEVFSGRALEDQEKARRLEEIIMGIFGNSKGNVSKQEQKFGEVPPKPKLGFSPKKDKALVHRDNLEGWRKGRRSI